jgi:methylmalonyl-CoA/ethylmalonyl-CoA epimerase
MNIRRITEVGIAVPHLDSAVELFENLFDADVGVLIDVPLYDMEFKMCRVGKVDFEVMAPTGPTGVIADFLAKRGPGLHHIAFAVDDINDTMQSLGDKGVQFVADKPATLSTTMVDFAGRRFDDDISFTFSHPASILGILFEFIEYPEGFATP